MDFQEGEQEESWWMHEVKKASTQDGVSVSSFDKLTQVIEQMLGAGRATVELNWKFGH
ncbi:hypothetical protein DPMN_104121 [Dreissena polymorpha]|uniref:Uncharacterized protein n=1 Tax=Dreissena polymorpha TaxID=45954 RepID=A0A9D4HB10_DREPO|nr:hypothetical protein DPMN_104121 [Dreissena polymorpha]